MTGKLRYLLEWLLVWNGVESDVTYQLEVLLGNLQVLPGPILLEDETFCDLNYHQRRTQGPFHLEMIFFVI